MYDKIHYQKKKKKNLDVCDLCLCTENNILLFPYQNFNVI